MILFTFTKIRHSPEIADVLFAFLIAAAIAVAASGCDSVRQSAPVKGGSYALASPMADWREVLDQGHNANSPSTLLRTLKSYDVQGNVVSEASTRIELGTSRDPVITLAPAPPYGQYAVAVIGALAMIGGTVLAFKSWPKIGATLGLGGFTVMVIALTAGQYGWLWALIAAGVFGCGVFALYSGYRSGIEAEKSTIGSAGIAA